VNNATKLGAFGLAVAAVFAGALAVGAAAGPIDVGGSDHSTMADSDADAVEILPGVAVAAEGYRLVLDTDRHPAGRVTSLGFEIVDDAGVALTAFDQLHERELHFIVVSRDLVDYLHLHPTRAADGHWTVEVPALQPGSYRVFADFQPSGTDQLTLGADVTVPGLVPDVELPPVSATSEVDGYTVTVSTDPQVGETQLEFDVAREGRQVTTEPYLGAAAHLVAIRRGDLAYLHVHPLDTGETTIAFLADFPSAGTYRLFLDFSHDGVVRTASFTVDVPNAVATTSEGMTPATDDPANTDPAHEGEGH